MHDSQPKASTLSVWGGETEPSFARATHIPVVHSVSYSYPDIDEWLAAATGRIDGHIYSRNTNPTVAVFEEKVRLLEDGEAATSASTGMAAISATLFALLAPGQRIVATKGSYGGTIRILTEFLPRMGVEVVLTEVTNEALLEALETPCDVVYLETPTNPMLCVLDLERIIRAARDRGAIVIVDNTFATPINQSPLSFGADLVLHSATKYLGGHGDALGGVVVGRRELIDKVFAYREINGATLHASTAYLLIRGLKTLELRVERQNASAQRIAMFLEGHAKVESVNYPGLTSHPSHAIAARQMRGFGGMLSFNLKGEFDAVRRFSGALQFAHAAASLGAVETMIGLPATASHVECTREERARLGIPEGLIRYSTGIENVEDLLADLEQALEAV